MSEGVYALLGVVVGALSTGAVQALLEARARRRRALVAARLVLSSLEQYDYLIRRLLKFGNWSGHAEWLARVKALPEPWRENQSVLAEIRDFKDWVDVTNAFIEADDRFVFSAAILAGEDLSKDSRADLEEVLESLERARIVVARISMTRWYRLRLRWRSD